MTSEADFLQQTETQRYDKKSLKLIVGKKSDWNELAKDCVCFANSKGGDIVVGVEDCEQEPPSDQRLPANIVERIKKRIRELTINVYVSPQILVATNGGEYLRITIPRSPNVASTSDGKYYIRISDTCEPVLGDDILRLIGDRTAAPWESLTKLEVSREQVDSPKFQTFCDRIKASDRVKASVKEKTNSELLDHYFLAQGEWLTNLGILCVGQRGDRARLGTAPIIQFIKYDQNEQKVNKLVWDDYSLSPIELVEAVWQEIPDFREKYEIPDGLFRQSLPLYDEIVVRELLVNALVHRPYSQRGDIFLNLFSDRLKVVNPGPLPIGVTPQNILHTTFRRNDNLARIFHDLKLMEREGSGFDKMYEVLLFQGKALPELKEGNDRVELTIYRSVLDEQLIDLLAMADQQYQLKQRERITLGLLAQRESLSANELIEQLKLHDNRQDLSHWLGRLQELGLVEQSGRTRGTRYNLTPSLRRDLKLQVKTTLQSIEPHRLEALVLEDLRRYPSSSMGEINERVGLEISRSRLKRAVQNLTKKGELTYTGEKRGRRYSASSLAGQ